MQTRKPYWHLLFRLSALSLAPLLLLTALLLLLQLTLPVARAAPAQLQLPDDFYWIMNSSTTEIDPDDDTNSGVGGVCTLRDAISAVNDSAGDGTHVDGCDVLSFGSPTDTYVIFLPLGGYTYTLDSGELSVTDNVLFILGDTAANTIIQANAAPNTADFRVFGNYGDALTLEKVTIRHGRCAGTCTVFSTSSGGGIYNGPNRLLTLDGSVVISNVTTTGGGGIYNSGTLVVTNSSVISANTTASFGGGIQSSGSTTLDHSTVSFNTLTGNGRGGGLYVSGETLVVTNSSTIANNSAPNAIGGGIYIQDATATVANSAVISNTSSAGGGIEQLLTSTLTVVKSTISFNTASLIGGGIQNLNTSGNVFVTDSTIAHNLANGGSGGGGLAMNAGKATLVNSTIHNNTGAGNGGGIINGSAAVITLTGSSILSNTTNGSGGGLRNLGTATLSDSLIRNNTALTTTTGGGGLFNGSAGLITVTGSRILSNTTNGNGSGVFNDNNSAGAANITGSCIVGNSTVAAPAAFRNNQAAQQIATGNWWGTATGPNTPNADTSSGAVDSSGFLTTPPFSDCPDKTIVVSSSKTFLPLVIKPGPGSFSGRVTAAATGQPIEDMYIFPLDPVTGEWDFGDPFASTDANGNFEVEEVPAGTYKVLFSGEDIHPEYADRYYNNKTTLATANTITIQGGQNTPNINAAMVKK